jgi:hypothetical protein
MRLDTAVHWTDSCSHAHNLRTLRLIAQPLDATHDLRTLRLIAQPLECLRKPPGSRGDDEPAVVAAVRVEGGVVAAMNLFMQQHGVAVLATTVQAGVEGALAVGVPGCRSALPLASLFLAAGSAAAGSAVAHGWHAGRGQLHPAARVLAASLPRAAASCSGSSFSLSRAFCAALRQLCLPDRAFRLYNP